MLRLMLYMLGEILAGIFVGGLVLAISIPMLMRAGLITTGDLAGILVIVATLVLTVAGMLFRPGSALNRRTR
jgi:formate-dependent nitrite reductase membrane component NrfD